MEHVGVFRALFVQICHSVNAGEHEILEVGLLMHLLHVEGQAVSQRLSDITIDFEYVIIEELTDKGLM